MSSPYLSLFFVTSCEKKIWNHLLHFQRNGTLTEYATMHTGHTGMEKFGYFDKLNGLDHMPQWEKEPCSSIEASEGSFFPPREVTNSDVVYIYDKDLCRSLPLVYRHPVEKDGEGYFLRVRG